MRHANKVLGAIAAIVAVTTIYFAIYLATVVPRPNGFDPYEPLWFEDFNFLRSAATYRFGGKAAKLLFTPANELDRKLRPKTWQFNPFADMPVGSGS